MIDTAAVPVCMQSLLLPFAACFTKPGYRNFVTLTLGWIACQGRHSISRIIQAAGACQTNHARLYRFLSRARWNCDAAGHIVFGLLLVLLDRDIIAIVDDTLCKKSGPHIFGAAMHHDACSSSYAKRSSASSKTFAFGHNWVVLAIWIPVPWNPHRGLAIPILFRLYRSKKRCPPKDYRKRTELADQLIKRLLDWLPPDRTLMVTADSEYACRTLLRHRQLRFTFVGPMSMNAALYDLPVQSAGRGRKRVKGVRLPSPEKLENQAAVPWSQVPVTIYGKSTAILVKSQRCLWYTVTGTKPIRMVLTRDPKGRIDDRAYFTTDPDMPIEKILMSFAHRWEIEVAFRNNKQFMGLEDPQNGWWRRKTEEPAPKKTPGPNPHPTKGHDAIMHTFSMALTAYAITILWYLFHGDHQKDVKRVLAEAPWYRHKKTPSFMDMIASCRRRLWSHRFSSTPAQNRVQQNISDFMPHWLLAAA
jgi:SRSO17 transposase